MSVQPVPPHVQRCHRYVNDVGLFVQVPLVVETVCPCCAVPDTTGGVLFAGGGPVTCAVCALGADAEPAPFVAVTTTRRVLPTSSEPTTYVEPVAPPMSPQAGTHRCHW